MTVITFNNGAVIEAQQNGNCFITDSKPEFPDDLTNITVTSEQEYASFNDAMLVECASMDGKYWFTFIEIPESEKMKANLEYIAMMADVDLEG